MYTRNVYISQHSNDVESNNNDSSSASIKQQRQQQPAAQDDAHRPAAEGSKWAASN